MANTTCSFDDCERDRHSRGLCHMHARRLRRTGDANKVRKIVRMEHPFCIVEGCDERSHAKDMCGAHYSRNKRLGSPTAGGTRRYRGDTAVRFWPKVDRQGPDDCWPWTASITPNGYGQFSDGGRLVAAHRVALELHSGPVDSSLDVDHTCHNGDMTCPNGPLCVHRRCCNPRHLEAVTHLENVRRGHANLRTGPR